MNDHGSNAEIPDSSTFGTDLSQTEVPSETTIPPESLSKR